MKFFDDPNYIIRSRWIPFLEKQIAALVVSLNGNLSPTSCLVLVLYTDQDSELKTRKQQPKTDHLYERMDLTNKQKL